MPLILALLMTLVPGSALAWTVEFTETEIQAEVAQLFPVRQELPFVTAVFSDPQVRIVEDTDRVRLALAIRTQFPNRQEATGQAEIEGSIGYDAGSGEFHLIQPEVTVLAFDRLQQEHVDMIRLMLNAVAEHLLPNIVVHQLDDRDFRQGMMRRSLKDVRVSDGKVVAELYW